MLEQHAVLLLAMISNAAWADLGPTERGATGCLPP